MSEPPKVGDFVVVQRQSYMKLHKLALSGSVKLGKSIVLTDNVLGRPYWTTYRMEPHKNKRGYFNLVECLPEDIQCKVLMKDVSSGLDNRNILDDGSSQKLSSEEIIGMRDEGLSAKEIVGTLIENSTTFQEKTEYSQEKYLKKKEKKYFEYVVIRKPTIRLIADIMFKQDPNNILGLRSDTLSQLTTAVNLHPHGVYIMYESGCQSLASATILNALSPKGRLILVHPGSQPQKQAISGMNYQQEDQQKLMCVNIYTLLRKLIDCRSQIKDLEEYSKMENKPEENDQQSILEEKNQQSILEEKNQQSILEEKDQRSILEEKDQRSILEENAFQKNSLLEDKEDSLDEKTTNGAEICTGTVDNNAVEELMTDLQNETGSKRKLPEEDYEPAKKPRYEIEADRAVSLIKDKKADGLLVIGREHPANILKNFLPFVGRSKNIVVYGAMREPLQELSIELRKRPDVIFVELTEMWLRNFQVLENRTHPFVSMSGGGGYLLTGIKVE